MTSRRKFTPEIKAKVILGMLTDGTSLAQASREYGLKGSVLSRWKHEFIERSPMLFEQGQAKDERDEQIGELERMVGRLTMELDMAKKLSRHLG